MCGIAGVVSDDPELRSATVVRRMSAAIAHRGPDEEVIATAGVATLGVRRLAVIDVMGGRQPMLNESGDVYAIQNGEIYNFTDLREELKSRGHQFRTRSDTEVLPHAYEEWGSDLVSKLRGMFAIAVWDDRQRTLVLARDRFGKKPLFYGDLPNAFIFGSELQALLAHPAVGREVDAEAIDQYLRLGYVPAPLTAFSALRKLEPGHTVTLRDGHLTSKRYWRLSFSPKLQVSLDEAASELRTRIDDAVRVRMISDVPIGAFLSGGLDSSTVVSFMANHSERPVKTFSIGFGDQAFDERRYARLVAQKFGTEHHEFVVDIDEAADLPMLVRNLGEPFADSSIVPTYHVARITRQHVTVALNGDGGDELFAGYDRYKAAAFARLTFERLPRRLVRWVASAASAIPQDITLPRVAGRVRRFLSALDSDPEARYMRWTGYFTGQLREVILGARLREPSQSAADEPLRRASELLGATEAAERYMGADILMGLPGDLLVKMDIATMAASLEGRSPLLDHELAEFVARLPASYKLSPFTSKVLLRRAMKGILPAEVLRRGKMGFTAPVGKWLRGPMRPMFRELVLADDARSRDYVAQEGAEQLFDDHCSGRADRAPLLWNLLMLELWFRECVANAPTGTSHDAPHRVGASL